MTMTSNSVCLGFDLDKWHYYGTKLPIITDISPKTNVHTLLCGMSGSGKSFCELILFGRHILANPNGEYYFADYKQDDSFSFLRECPRYYPYIKTIDALNIVYEKFQNRLSGTDKTRHPIVLIWDEYISNILSLLNEDKKKATLVMNMVSEILMLGRSLSVRLLISCQRADAMAFPSGSRLNYGIIIILGAPIKSTLEMLMPNHIEHIKDRCFQVGEGVVLLQGSELHFIKIPMVRDMNKLQKICVQALS